MAIPTVFASVKPQDFTLKPFTVHKRFTTSNVELINTSSGYAIVDGIHTTYKTPIGSKKAANDPRNSFDGSYQHVIWHSINHMYYKHPYDAYATFEHANRRFTWKFLNYSASLMSIPYLDYGERIKPASVEVTNSSHAFTLRDDGNGNLYDPAIDTGSFTNNYNVVGYWGFNDQFKHFPYFSGTRTHGNLWYESRVFEPDEPSTIRNIKFDSGVAGTGMRAHFDGTSYIMTHNRPEFNPDKNDEFSISFWIKAPVSQSNTDTHYNSIISKRGVIRKQLFGDNSKYNQNNMLVTTRHISASIENEPTNVYFYDIEMMNHTHPSDAGKIRYRHSNGVDVREMTSSIIVADGTDHHVVLKAQNNGQIVMTVDGAVQGTVSRLDIKEDIYNDHSLMFGAVDRTFKQGFSGSLDEIRVYDTAITTDQISTLMDSASMAMYQTAVVGNVFYRQGNIVVSPLQPKYQRAFKDNWVMHYRGTHTIYQYEVLCRIKKGSFNLTYNPTARQSFKSDLLINDMTGSLLAPYFTTIGLYNGSGELIVVAKMGQPIQVRDDVDINVLIKWDA